MNDDRLDDLTSGFEALQAAQVGLTIAIKALISTHPDYAAAQMRLTVELERELGNGGRSISGGMTEKQTEQVRELVEWLGAVRPTDAP